ncbi:MAG: Tsi3 family protein [Cyanobacteria bacterium J06639_18]
MHKVNHPNGLQLKFPQTLSIEKIADGFLIQPSNWQELRSPSEIIVNLNTSQELSKQKWDGSKKIDGKVIYFRVEEVDGGSGGNIYTLIASKPLLKGYIYLKQTVQAEDINQADFSLGWNIIENSDFKM